MKKLFTALIVVLVAGIVLVGVAFSMGVDFSQFSSFIYNDADYTQATYTATADATSINIDAENRDVRITHADQDKISISYYYEEKDIIAIDVEDGELKFSQTREFIYTWFRWGITSASVRLIDIVVPNDVVATVDVNVASGDIDITGTFSNVELNSASGDLNIANASVASITASTLSGQVEFQTVTANDVYMSSASGQVVMTDSTCGAKVEMRTASGRVSMQNTTVNNDIVLFTMSGEVSARNVSTPTNINAQTSSGTVSVIDVAAIDYYAKSMSGNVVLDLPLDDSEYDFELSTMSGMVRLNSITSGKSYSGGDGAIPVYGSTSSGNVTVTTL